MQYIFILEIAYHYWQIGHRKDLTTFVTEELKEHFQTSLELQLESSNSEEVQVILMTFTSLELNNGMTNILNLCYRRESQKRK